jgi:hypothetical protein
MSERATVAPRLSLSVPGRQDSVLLAGYVEARRDELCVAPALLVLDKAKQQEASAEARAFECKPW